ncbi:MAG: archaemetzincin family Zn-dependent metalloprotease [Candidatus Thermoplasmatota archaeon]|nr:archaemetzincin family Zn-dependent metalloprotease [Candidatus Thermoplasmatota archaeon]
MQVSVLPAGDVEKNVLEALDADLRRAGVGVTTLPSQGVPGAAHNPERDQYRAPELLKMGRRAHGEHVLVVTEVDLYVDPLNFVFGQADVGGQAAVISLHRLSPDDSRLFRFRALKEALHELGHNVGLDHCPEATCVMHFSNELADTDRKGPNLCPDCVERVGGEPPWRVPA